MSPARLRSGWTPSSRSTGAQASGTNDADHDVRSTGRARLRRLRLLRHRRPRSTGRKSRRAFREVFESLSLATQFRVAARRRHRDADRRPDRRRTLGFVCREAGRPRTRERRGHCDRDASREVRASNALDGLAGHRVFLAADLNLPTGEVLERYDRGTSMTTPMHQVRRSSGRSRRPAADSLHRVLRFLALEPTYVEHAVQVTPAGDRDLRPAARQPARLGRRRGPARRRRPIVLMLGLLVAFVAANALKRQVVEPLVQLADATRIRGIAGLGRRRRDDGARAPPERAERTCRQLRRARRPPRTHTSAT